MDWATTGDWIQQQVRALGDWLASASVSLLQLLVIVVVARFVVGWARGRINRPRLVHRLGPNLVTLLGNVAAILIYIVALSLVLGVFGVSLSAVIAYLSVTTLAVGLALQETLRNTIAGIYLLVERPFNIGDRITVRDVTGRLEGVELRTTAIRSEVGDLVLVPNSIVFTEIVTNRTATKANRTRVQVAKLLLDPVEAQSAIRAVVDGLDGLEAPGPIVEAIGHTAAGTVVNVSVWHARDDAIRTRLIAAIRERFPDSEVTSAADIPA